VANTDYIYVLSVLDKDRNCGAVAVVVICDGGGAITGSELYVSLRLRSSVG
jgi:hypothetical protein